MKKTKLLLGLTTIPLVVPTITLSSCNNEETIGFYNIPRNIYAQIEGSEGKHQSPSFTIVKRSGSTIQDITDQITDVKVESDIQSLKYDLSKHCLTWDNADYGDYKIKLSTEYEGLSTEFETTLHIYDYSLNVTTYQTEWCEGDSGLSNITVTVSLSDVEKDITNQTEITLEDPAQDFPTDKIYLRNSKIVFEDGIAPGQYLIYIKVKWSGITKRELVVFNVKSLGAETFNFDLPSHIITSHPFSGGSYNVVAKAFDTSTHKWSDVSKDISVDFLDTYQASNYEYDKNSHSIKWKKLSSDINQLNMEITYKASSITKFTKIQSLPNEYSFDASLGGMIVGSLIEPTPDIVIPSTITYDGDVKTVKSISVKFRGNTNINSISLPNTIESLPNEFFLNSSIKKVVFEKNSIIKELPMNTFGGCKKLESVVMPDSVLRMYGGVFDHCSNLTYVILPKNLQEMSEYTFQETHIIEIEIPDSTTMWTDRGCNFRNCRALEKVNFPTAQTQMPPKTFEGCINLRQIIYHQTLSKLKDVVKGVDIKWCEGVPRTCLIKCTDQTITLKELLGE